MKKGFTLIELLAVIIILAIIALIAIPSMIGIMDKVKESAFERQKEYILDAAKVYAVRNPEVTELGYVSLKELIENNYIDSGIKDDKGNVMDDTYIVSLTSKKVVTTTKHEGESVVVDNSVGAPISKIIINGKSAQNIPIGYTFYDYIESTGNQYINTGFYPNNNTRVVAEYSSTDLSINNPVFGARNVPSGSSWNNSFSFWGNVSGGSPRLDYNNTSIGISSITAGIRYKVELNKNLGYFNNNSLTPYSISTFQCTKPLLFLAQYVLDTSEAISVFSKMKLYYAKVYDNGTLIRNYVGAKRNSDNVIGMYDLVNNVFYTNQGTGNFVSGNTINLSHPDHPLEINNVSDFDLISKGKNLFDYQTMKFYNSSNNEDIISFNQLVWDRILNKSAWVPKESTNYTIVLDILENTFNNTFNIRSDDRFYFENTSQTIPVGFVGRKVFNVVTRSDFSNVTLGSIWFNTSNTVTGNFKIRMMILEGSYDEETAGVYQNYQYSKVNFPYTLRSLPNDIKDYIVIDNVNNTAKLYQNIGVKIFDGTENNWDYESSTSRFFISIADKKVRQSTTSLASLLSTHFYTVENDVNSDFTIREGGSKNVMFKYSMLGSNINDFKTWLNRQYTAGTPVTIEYELETPIVTDLDYDLYKNIATYKGVTTISKTGIKSNIETKMYTEN